MKGVNSYKISNIFKQNKIEFISNAFNNSDNYVKYWFWLNELVKEKDINVIVEKILEYKLHEIDFKYKTIFGLIKLKEEQREVLNNILAKLGIIDNIDKIKRVKVIIELNEIYLDLKKDFLNSLISICTKEFRYEIFCELDTKILIDFILKLEYNNIGDAINYIEQNLLQKNFKKYDNIKDLIRLLKKFINTNNYENINISNINLIDLFYKSIDIDTKIYLWLQDSLSDKFELKYQKDISTIYKIDDKLELLLNKNNFCFNQCLYFVFLSELNKIYNEKDFNGILEKLRKFRYYLSHSYLLFENILLDKFENKGERIKLWIYDLINEFDFNSYCFYYFTLNSEERKIFNRKAKSIMKEDLKTSMLKKKEPWQFIEKLEEEEGFVSIFSASWKSIWYGDKNIRICIDSEPSFTKPYYWEFSEEKFNLLYDYISGKRLKDIKIYVSNNRIIKIEGLDDLEEIIWKVQIQKEIETGENGISRGIGTNKIPTNMILRNQCIQLLNKLQLREFEPTRILEKTLNIIKGGLSVDISLLYSIPINDYEIAIIWESLELEKSKATHIFKCLRSEYDNILLDIEKHLSSKLKVRSSLNSIEDIEQNKKLRYLCRIDHDNFNFNKWENSLYEILPEFKDKTLQ